MVFIQNKIAVLLGMRSNSNLVHVSSGLAMFFCENMGQVNVPLESGLLRYFIWEWRFVETSLIHILSLDLCSNCIVHSVIHSSRSFAVIAVSNAMLSLSKEWPQCNAKSMHYMVYIEVNHSTRPSSSDAVPNNDHGHSHVSEHIE